MSKLCPHCYFIGRGKNGFLNGNQYIGIIFVALGIFGLVRDDYLFGSYAAWIGLNVLLIALGIFRIVEHYVGGIICPKCAYKPMIAVDTPEAIRLIKEHDFKLGAPDTGKQETGG